MTWADAPCATKRLTSQSTSCLRKVLSLNIPLLTHAAYTWVDILDFDAAGGPRTPPLQSLSKEVFPASLSLISFMAFTRSSFNKSRAPKINTSSLSLSLSLLPSFSFFCFLPILCQVKAFWKLLFCDDVAAMPGKVSRHADAWGVRKMLSHIFRQMRLARQPMDPRL